MNLIRMLAAGAVAITAGLALSATDAHAATRPLSIQGAKSVFRSGVKATVDYQLDQGAIDSEDGHRIGGWTDHSQGGTTCHRVRRLVVDCEVTLRFHRAEDDTYYSQGKECYVKLRIRRFADGGSGLYDNRHEGEGGDPSSTPCRDYVDYPEGRRFFPVGS
jgi:hypothetical protein